MIENVMNMTDRYRLEALLELAQLVADADLLAGGEIEDELIAAELVASGDYAILPFELPGPIPCATISLAATETTAVISRTEVQKQGEMEEIPNVRPTTAINSLTSVCCCFSK